MLHASSLKKLVKPLISSEQYDFWAEELGSLARWERCFARVVSRRDESANSFTLTLKPNTNMPSYRAGQHINLSARIAGRHVTRSYSLTSLPHEPCLSITLRREEGGLMSNWLYNNAHPGTPLEIGNVFGEMTLHDAELANDDDLLLLAAGSGITPLFSLLRDAIHKEHRGQVHLLYWDKSPENFCFNKELDRDIQQGKVVVHRITTGQDGTHLPINGRICKEQLEALSGHVLASKPATFICGGAGFVEAAHNCLRALGQQRIYSESFTPPAFTSDEAEAIYQVALTRTGRTLEVSSRTNLLDALEAQGVAVTSGCRMGICNTCACPSSAGTVLDSTTGLQQSESAVRLCISQARSHLTLDL